MAQNTNKTLRYNSKKKYTGLECSKLPKTNERNQTPKKWKPIFHDLEDSNSKGVNSPQIHMQFNQNLRKLFVVFVVVVL